MSCRRRVWAAVRSAAALCLCCVCVPLGPARANDFDDPRIMLFSGRDIWRNGAFAHGGFIVAPSGFDQDGLLLKVMLSGGLYRYDAQNLGGERVVGAEWLTQHIAGLADQARRCRIQSVYGARNSKSLLAAGRSRQSVARLLIRPARRCGGLVRANRGNDDRGRRFTVVDRNQQLGTASPMAGGCSKRCLAEFISDRKFNISAPTAIRHGRLGMHITSMKTEDTEWSAAAGWARDSAGRSSPYVRLSILTRR